MFVAALSVSTLTSTVRMFSSAIVEEKNERFRAIEQSLWILTKFKISEIFPRNGGGDIQSSRFRPASFAESRRNGLAFRKVRPPKRYVERRLETRICGMLAVLEKWRDSDLQMERRANTNFGSFEISSGKAIARKP